MDNTYYVTKETDCQDCNGWGTVTHAAWKQYYERFSREEITPSDEDIDSFWKECGFDYQPDEEHPCDECNGTGKVRSEADLADAIRDILNIP